MTRVILHVDANSFYASVECLYHPELRGKPVSVCGDPEARHGIVLTSTIPAKKRGVKTGMAIWQAKQLCPELIVVPPNYQLYLHFSQMMRELLTGYSQRVESFGLDESWADITQPGMTFADGERIANEIRMRVRDELGITVSIGVSYNKVLAKLGSDMKKPDAVTVLPPEALSTRVWPLPVGELLYVGPRTTRKLMEMSIHTIGDLANAPSEALLSRLGRNGLMLQLFARGEDTSPVAQTGVESAMKSIGNSTTTPHDIETVEDARCVLWLLSESVAARLREHGFQACCVSVSARTTTLQWSSHQSVLDTATSITGEIAKTACALFEARYMDALPLRSVGVQCSRLVSGDAPVQLDMFGDQQRRERLMQLDTALDGLRRRYGHQVVRRGVVMADDAFARINPKEEHLIHPVAFVAG